MRIVVRGTNWIGDAVMSVPAMREIRRLFPDSRIALHTRSWARDIFTDSGLFDEIIPIDQAAPRALSAIREAGSLRPSEFDLAVLFTNSFSTAFAARIAGIERRFGYATEGRGFLLSDPVGVPEWKNRRHEVFYYLNLAAEIEKRMLGTETVVGGEPIIDLAVSSERRTEARKLLADAGVRRGPLIALAAGSTNSLAKRWGAEKFASLNDRLQNELGASVILLGSGDEKSVSEAVSSQADREPVDLTGRTSLAQAAAVLAEADILVSNDMGLAHLAPAVGTETVVIFGPTDPATTRPFSPRAEVIRAGVECSPCMLRDCPIDHRCMTGVTVSQVFGSVSRKLSERNV